MKIQSDKIFIGFVILTIIIILFLEGVLLETTLKMIIGFVILLPVFSCFLLLIWGFTNFWLILYFRMFFKEKKFTLKVIISVFIGIALLQYIKYLVVNAENCYLYIFGLRDCGKAPRTVYGILDALIPIAFFGSILLSFFQKRLIITTQELDLINKKIE